MTRDREQKQSDEKLDKKLRMARAERYACQSVVRKIFPKERVSKCLRVLANHHHKSFVDVWKHKKTEKAFYAGLMVCGSVWYCPVCAAKISEKRRKELQQAFNAHKREGGHIALLTLTFSHKKVDKLSDILEKFGQATQKFMSGKAYQNIRDKMGLIGRIRVLEVTYGRNGFHPHTHISLFYENDVDLEEIKKEMYSLWEKACSKFELKVTKEHGLDLQNGEKADEYLSKHGTWSLDQELSKAHIKKAKNGSMTPFDFLRKYLEEEDKKYLALFKEYAQCFKGKRQLQWSQGLKKRFVLEDKTDEEVAQEKTEEADLLGSLDLEFWQLILKHENRSRFLDLCEQHDFEKAIDIVQQNPVPQQDSKK